MLLQDWETVYGIHMSFAPDSYGNRGSVTDSHVPAHETSYTYEWGVMKDTQTPEFTVNRDSCLNLCSCVTNQIVFFGQ